MQSPLQWLHNEPDDVSDHQPQNCLVNRLFRRRSKKTSKLRVTGLCDGNSPVNGEYSSWPFVRGIHGSPVNSPHKGPRTRQMFLFDDHDLIFPWTIITPTVSTKTFTNILLNENRFIIIIILCDLICEWNGIIGLYHGLELNKSDDK